MKRLITTAFIGCALLVTPVMAQTPAEDHHESTMQRHEEHKEHREEHKKHRHHHHHHHKDHHDDHHEEHHE